MSGDDDERGSSTAVFLDAIGAACTRSVGTPVRRRDRDNVAPMPLRLSCRESARRRSLAAFAPVLVVASLTRASPAFAGDPCQAAPDLSTCINADNLWPHAGPQIFATVGGVETVEQGKFGFGLVTDYQSRPIVFHVPTPGQGGSDQYAVDNQVNGTFLWAVGITRQLELDLALPVTFGQTGSGASPITGSNVPLHPTAMRDLRFGLAYQLVPRIAAEAARVLGLTARFEVSAPTGDRDQYAGDATAVFAPSLAADYRRGRWFAGLEIGARIRPDAQVQGANVGPQGTVALGLGYDLLRRAKLLDVMVEARSLPTFATQYNPDQTASGTMLAPSEWMVSLRSSPLASDDVSITLGGGGAITPGAEGFTAPRFRFLLGLRYAPTGPAPHGGKGSPPAFALGSKTDSCKDDPDSADGFKDDDGCPDEDADKDGVDDRYDRCPLEPEDFAGLTDGCPESAAPHLKP
jgi:OmpA-OmpF porin, OOP family